MQDMNPRSQDETPVPAAFRIAILGAGISGLSCALQLLDRGYRHIHFYERSPGLGGLATTIEVEDRRYDLGALLIGGGYSRLRELCITDDCAATTVLSDRAYMAARMLKAVAAWLPIVASERVQWPPGCKWVSVESIWHGEPPRGYQLPAVAPKATALLQYTSGSTSAPRGVMLSHANIMHNVYLQGEGGVTAQSQFVFFVPQYHDLGLIGGSSSRRCAASRRSS